MPPYVDRVTKYNPADRNEHGHYMGPEDTLSDHGPVEAAYLATVAAFAEDSGVQHLTIREPAISGPIHFGLEEAVDGYGFGALFPRDLTGYHDVAEVPLAVALELLRAMLRVAFVDSNGKMWERSATALLYPLQPLSDADLRGIVDSPDLASKKPTNAGVRRSEPNPKAEKIRWSEVGKRV
ncbi:hypothetical protein [Streptomyces sp. NPDC001820]|uniref:hypothetical protein n=1 Tax=Streptomyces sp. NPDC001820 TaxID=3364613 RepID=UPI0036BC3133